MASKMLCNNCSKLASMLCQRCMDPYCSRNCQLSDWQKHKLVCIKMPDLVPVENMLNDFKINEKEESSIIADLRTNHDNRQDEFSCDKQSSVLDEKISTEPPRTKSQPKKLDAGTQNNGAEKIDGYTETEFKFIERCKGFTDIEGQGSIKQKDGRSNTDLTTAQQKKKESATNPNGGPKNNDSPMVQQTLPSKSSKDDSKYFSMKPKVGQKEPEWKLEHLPRTNVYFDVIIKFAELFDDATVLCVIEVEYEELLHSLQMKINDPNLKLQKCKINDLHLGQLVAAPIDAKYYRAEILELDFNLHCAVVELIDYGRKAQVSYEYLHEALPFMTNLKRFAFRIHIIEDKIDFSVNSVINVRLLNKKTSEGIHYALLNTESSKASKEPWEEVKSDEDARSCEVIRHYEEAKPIEEARSCTNITRKIYTLDDLEIIMIKAGENVPIGVFDYSTIKNGCITAVDLSNAYVIEEMEKYFTKINIHCSDPKIKAITDFRPKKYELCLACFEKDQIWYRAVCVKENMDDTYILMYIDYGNYETVPGSKTRPMLDEFMFPTNANLCYIKEVNSELTKLLTEKSSLAVKVDHINGKVFISMRNSKKRFA